MSYLQTVWNRDWRALPVLQGGFRPGRVMDVTSSHRFPEVVLEVSHLTKIFAGDLRTSLRYAARDIVNELRGRPSRTAGRLRPGEFKAVDDVSFVLHPGEALGIVGDNGAGKSTLLKVIHGLLRPDAGSVRIRGRIGALLELGTGFDPVLSGRENILGNGAVMGLTGKRLAELSEEIISFAELEDVIDTPVKYYSSGMVSRLAFAIAAHLDPDVLLIDEVLAVGDFAFQRKCATHMLRYVGRGGALIFVSHNAHQVLSLCSRGLLLQEGRATFRGSAVETLGHYYATRVVLDPAERPAPRDPNERWPIVIDRLSLTGLRGDVPRTGEAARVELEYRSVGAFQAIWGFSIHTADQWICITSGYDLGLAVLPGCREMSHV